MLLRYDLHHAGVDHYRRYWMDIPLRIFCRLQVCPHGQWSTSGYTIISESIRTLATIVRKCSAKFRPLSSDMTCEIRLHSSVRSSRVILWRDSMKIFACRSFGLYMPFRVLSWKLFCTRLQPVMRVSCPSPLLICRLQLRPYRLLRTRRLQQMYVWSTHLYLRSHMLSLTFWTPLNLTRVLIFTWIP